MCNAVTCDHLRYHRLPVFTQHTVGQAFHDSIQNVGEYPLYQKYELLWHHGRTTRHNFVSNVPSKLDYTCIRVWFGSDSIVFENWAFVKLWLLLWWSTVRQLLQLRWKTRKSCDKNWNVRHARTCSAILVYFNAVMPHTSWICLVEYAQASCVHFERRKWLCNRCGWFCRM